MPSEIAASLMGPGPWTLQLALKVPNTLHFSNKNKRGPIQISHALTIVIRVERGDDEQLDPKTGKRKRFDVILQMPVHILSVLYPHPFMLRNMSYLRYTSPAVGKRAARCSPTLYRNGRHTIRTARFTHLFF